jgi:hypothetical protein
MNNSELPTTETGSNQCGWLLSFDLVIKPVIDFLDNCLVLNFQILTTYLDDLNIIQWCHSSHTVP